MTTHDEMSVNVPGSDLSTRSITLGSAEVSDEVVNDQVLVGKVLCYNFVCRR